MQAGGLFTAPALPQGLSKTWGPSSSVFRVVGIRQPSKLSVIPRSLPRSFYSAESLGTSALLPFFMRAQATVYEEYVLDKELKWLLLDSQNLCEFVRCRPAPLIPLSEDGSTLTLS